MKYLFFSFAMLAVPVQILADVLVTDSYAIEVGSCPEGYVTCDSIEIKLKELNTEQQSEYTGETMHTLCKDGVTPCRFLGYRFDTGEHDYLLFESGKLMVNDKSGETILEEIGEWEY